MRLTMAHPSLNALIVLGGLVPVLVVATVAAKGVHRAAAVTVQTQTGCDVDQAIAVALPVLVVATVAAKGVHRAAAVAVQTQTGRDVDQAIAVALPVLVVAAVAAKGVHHAVSVAVQTETGRDVHIVLAPRRVRRHADHHQCGGRNGSGLDNSLIQFTHD